jgi:hypothetical protein
MRNKSELFFPCLESPLRLYLSVNEAEGEDNNKEDAEVSSKPSNPRWYLSISPVASNICMSDKPHEWHLLWTSSSNGDHCHDDDTSEGVSTSGFAIQSVTRNVFLCCNIEGELSTCSLKDLQTQPGYSWKFQYEDISGMVVQLINSTYQKRLTIQSQEEAYSFLNNIAPLCKTFPMNKGAESMETLSGWNIRFLSGELLFLSNALVDRRVRCNPMGKLDLDENWKGWEVFRFIEVGNSELQIVSWTHEKILCSDAHGTVTTTDDREDKSTKWGVAKSSNSKNGSGVILQSVEHGRYLCALNATELGTVDANGLQFAGAEWALEPANARLFYVTSNNNFLLSTLRDGAIGTSKRAKEYEEWKIEKIQAEKLDDETRGNVFSIFSCKHGKYLSSTKDGAVRTTDQLGEGEFWELEESTEEEGFFIISYSYNDRQLYCNNHGELATSSIDCQTWHLKPRIPGSISKNQIIFGGIAAASLLPLMVAPALGPLLWGSRLAISSVAVTGAVEAGSVAVVGTAAVVGTSAAVIVADHMKRCGKGNSQKNQHPIRSIHRPLVGWRSW